MVITGNPKIDKALNGLIIFALIIFLIGIIAFTYSRFAAPKEKTEETQSSSSSVMSIASYSSSSLEVGKTDIDLAGIEIARKLNGVLGINMGFIYSDTIEALGAKLPVKMAENRVKVTEEEKAKYEMPKQKRVSELVPIPQTVEKTNWISFPKYGIEAPLVYASFQDMFESAEDGAVDFAKPIQENPSEIAKGNYTSVPIQKLLQNGVVHLPFSPYPGDVGNSYIVGHSSNFSQVPSEWNYVFAPIERKSQVGDEFFIYDLQGRKLKFYVFDTQTILEADVIEAYRNFPGKRVVTLQASIVENGVASKRWLTRGELVLDDAPVKASSSAAESAQN